jgi:hypothetical protein
MATPAQIAANRRNALKSTGPRTASGKAASSLNALRHGLRARAAVVPGENPADLQRFRAELVAALAPRDGREEWLAEAAAEAAWRLRRVWRAEAALFNRHGRPDSACLRELRVLDRYEAAANRRFHRAVEMLEQGRTLERVARRRNRRSLSGSANRAALPRTKRPIKSSCADLFRASTYSFARKENVDGRDKHGHDDKRGKRLSSAVPIPESDSPGTSPVKTSSRGGCFERRRQDTPAPRRLVRNHRFCRRNPIWVPCADTQPLGASGIQPMRPSGLALGGRRIISWKSVPKRCRATKNPFECASTWPSWVEGRRAGPPHRQQTPLS